MYSIFKIVIVTVHVVRRRKRPELPSYVLRRFQGHPLRWNQSSEGDSETDEEICISQNANLYFNITDGVPGLQVTAKNSSQWTPIALRTRSKSKL